MFVCYYLDFFFALELEERREQHTPYYHTAAMDTLYRSIQELEARTQHTCKQLNASLAAGRPPPAAADLHTLGSYFAKLLDLYLDFIVHANGHGVPHVLATYRVPRRLWIYGVVAFVELLKNVQATATTPQATGDIAPAFVVHAFGTLAALYEIDTPTEWADKLAELARIAIQLYPANYLDWKSTASYWYHQIGLLGIHGHGKLYYHQCTVENDNLLAFALLSKALLCKDPFVPTKYYLQSIIDNACSQRAMLSNLEMSMIDFVKIHKILLLDEYSSNDEMKSIVSNYSKSFKSQDEDSQLYNTNLFSNPTLAFWFSKGPFFAMSNLNHLLGLGDATNLGARVFGLDQRLLERRVKKNSSTNPESITSENTNSEDSNPNDSLINSLQSINPGSIELAINMFKMYLNGPLLSALPPMIIHLWFLIGISKQLHSLKCRHHSAKDKEVQDPIEVHECTCSDIRLKQAKLFKSLILQTMPWNEIVKIINDVITLCGRNDLSQSLNEMLLDSKNKKSQEQNAVLAAPANVATTSTSGASPSGTIFTTEGVDDGIINSNERNLYEKRGGISSSLPGSPTPPSPSVEDTSSALQKEILEHCLNKMYPVNSETQILYGSVIFDAYQPSPPPFQGNGIDKSSLGEMIPWDFHKEGDKWMMILVMVGWLVDDGQWGLSFTSDNWLQFDNTLHEHDLDAMLSDLGMEVLNGFLLYLKDPRIYPLTQHSKHVEQQQEQHSQQQILVPLEHGDVNVIETLINLKPAKLNWSRNSSKFMNDFINGIFPANLLPASAYPGTQTHPTVTETEQEQNGVVTSDANLGYEPENEDENTDEEEEEEEEENIHQLPLQQQIQDDDGTAEEEDYSQGDEEEEDLDDDDLEEDDDEDDLDDDLDDIQNDLNSQSLTIMGDLGPNMDTILTFISLDTNIWLKYPGKIYKCVKYGIFRLCVPLTVFQELRSLRKSQDMTMADSATRSVLIIRQLYQEVDVLPLRSNGTKANSLNETLEFENNQQWRIQSDDLIIKSIILSNNFGNGYKIGLNFKIGPSPQWSPFVPSPYEIGSIWSMAYMGNGKTKPNFSIRGSKLKSQFINSKVNVLNENCSKNFWYNILITDDKNMKMKCNGIDGIKCMDSDWLWEKVDLVACGRCFN